MIVYTDEEIAQVCHEANRALQVANGERVISVHWPYLDAELRASIINGVINARKGCTPQESHENWVRFKLSQGWVHGEVKDFGAKTHPCLVPYDELPEAEKRKDSLFTSIVHALARP